MAPSSTRSRKASAIVISSSHDDGGTAGVTLRVSELNSLVLSLSTTVFAPRALSREARHTFSATVEFAGWSLVQADEHTVNAAQSLFATVACGLANSQILGWIDIKLFIVVGNITCTIKSPHLLLSVRHPRKHGTR